MAKQLGSDDGMTDDGARATPVAGSYPDGLPPLRDVIRQHGLDARKSLGQNFILDLNLTRRIARLGGSLSGATIVEIGPGPGGLTRALLIEGAAKVIAVERDQRCEPILRDIAAAYPGRLDIHMGDALGTDWYALLQSTANVSSDVRVVANLPYGIATPLLTGWLEGEPWPPWFSRLTLMFQREVAERIVAVPGTKAYGRLAVLAQWRTHPRIALSLKREAFTPAPKVASAVVDLVPRPAPQHCDAKRLSALTAAAFGQRRKMLRSSLKTITPQPEVLLRAAGIDSSWRAEQLSVTDFVRLAELLSVPVASGV